MRLSMYRNVERVGIRSSEEKVHIAPTPAKVVYVCACRYWYLISLFGNPVLNMDLRPENWTAKRNLAPQLADTAEGEGWDRLPWTIWMVYNEKEDLLEEFEKQVVRYAVNGSEANVRAL